VNLISHPVFKEPEVRALADEVMDATSRLFEHLSEHHPALIEVASRDCTELLRTLVVRHCFDTWEFILEEQPGDHARLDVVPTVRST
jgi:hypothetical protein